MWAAHTVTLAAGLLLLALGGEGLVRGAARLARSLGVSALVVGLTLVAFGTSAPEAAVTVVAATAGATELAVGNVVGSNIANILLIGGLAALLTPLAISRSLIRIDGPVMLVTAAALLISAQIRGHITRIEGAVFVAGLVAYTIATYRLARRDPAPTVQPEPLTGLARWWWYNLLFVLVGIAGVVLGAQLVVSGAGGLARLLDISEHVIGLTIVAIGTSLPELATSVAAARHRQPDIAIGNIVGSNIFNVLFVTGSAAVVKPLTVPTSIAHIDAPLMVAVSVVFYASLYKGGKISRWEGGVFLALYLAYLAWTILHAVPART